MYLYCFFVFFFVQFIYGGVFMKNFFYKFKIIGHSTDKFKFISLKSKIFYLSFLPSILIILLVLALSYTLSYGTLKETSLSREQQTLELISNQIDITLNSAESQLTNLITNNDIQEIFSKIKRLDTFPTDDEVIKIKNQLSNAIFKNTTISGVIIHSANNLSFKSNTRFLSLLETKNIDIEDFNSWKAPIFDSHQNPYIYLCKRMYNMNNGEFLGYVEIFVEEKLLSKNYTSSQFNKYSEIFIIDNEDNIISSVFKDKINSNINTIQKERDSHIKNKELLNTKVNTQKNSSLTFFNKKR